MQKYGSHPLWFTPLRLLTFLVIHEYVLFLLCFAKIVLVQHLKNTTSMFTFKQLVTYMNRSGKVMKILMPLAGITSVLKAAHIVYTQTVHPVLTLYTNEYHVV
jgi:hypothetical protein